MAFINFFLFFWKNLKKLKKQFFLGLILRFQIWMYYIKVSYCRTGYLDWVLIKDDFNFQTFYVLKLWPNFVESASYLFTKYNNFLSLKVSYFRNVFLVSSLSSKKRTKPSRQVVKLTLFVRSLDETSAWKNHFKFVYPLSSLQIMRFLLI